LPFPGIWVDEIAPEHEARDFIIKTNGVVAHAHGTGLGQLTLNGVGKAVLGHAFSQAGLRQDAGQQAGFRFGQEVGRGLAILHQRRADFIEIGVGADARKLRGAVATRHDAKGFVVVPIKGEIAHGSRARGPQSVRSASGDLCKQAAPEAKPR
jgi:hypothetical protein